MLGCSSEFTTCPLFCVCLCVQFKLPVPEMGWVMDETQVMLEI